MNPDEGHVYGDTPHEDILWRGRWLTVERLETSDWMLAAGWWDGAVELWLGRIVLRFQGWPGEYR